MITNENGVLCEDNSKSFCEALEKVHKSLSNYDEKKIRDSLSEYNWEKITNDKLLPLIIN